MRRYEIRDGFKVKFIVFGAASAPAGGSIALLGLLHLLY